MLQRVATRILGRGSVRSPVGWGDFGHSREGHGDGDVVVASVTEGLSKIYRVKREKSRGELRSWRTHGILRSGGRSVWTNSCVDQTIEIRGTLLSSNMLFAPVSMTWQSFYSMELRTETKNNKPTEKKEKEKEKKEEEEAVEQKKEEENNKLQEAGWHSKLWGEAKLLIRAYMTGAGSLASGIKSAARIYSKRCGLTSATTEDPSWKEDRTLYNTTENLKQSLPVFMLFMIPLLGNAVPLITVLFPQILHPSFRTEKQQRLLQIAFETNSKQGSGVIYQLIEKLRSGTKKFSKVLLSVVEEHFSFSSMSKEHTRALANCFPTTFTNYSFTSSLQLRGRLLKLAKLLIHEDPSLTSVSNLSLEELKNLAETRGFHFVNITDENALKSTLQSALEEWLKDSAELRTFFQKKYGKDYHDEHFDQVACTYLHLLAFFTHTPLLTQTQDAPNVPK